MYVRRIRMYVRRIRMYVRRIRMYVRRCEESEDNSLLCFQEMRLIQKKREMLALLEEAQLDDLYESLEEP